MFILSFHTFNVAGNGTVFLCILIAVASCLRDLRNEALVFLAGVVRWITTVAVVQQCCEWSGQ